MLEMVTKSVTVRFRTKPGTPGLTFEQLEKLCDIENYYKVNGYTSEEITELQLIQYLREIEIDGKLESHEITQEEYNKEIANLNAEDEHVNGCSTHANFKSVYFEDCGKYKGWFYTWDSDGLGQYTDITRLIHGIRTLCSGIDFEFIIDYYKNYKHEVLTLDEFITKYINK